MKKRTLLCLAIITGMGLATLIAQQLPVAKAVHVSKDSMAPPDIIPLRGELLEFDANPNVYPAEPVSTRRLPSNLKVVTLGKNGVPGPRTVEAKFKKIPVRSSASVAIEDPQAARDALYTIRYLAEDEGMQQATITSLLEDSRGHLWVAADQGYAVCRYDGERVTCFGEEEGFPLTWGIRNMLEDRQGRIWFSGEGGVCYYDGQYFWLYDRYGSDDWDKQWDNYASGVMEDRHGNIWFCYAGVYRYSGNEFTIYDPKVFPGAGGLIEDRHGHIWLGGNGVMRFDGEQVVYITDDDGLIDNRIGAAKETATGEIWFGSGGSNIGDARGVSRFIPDPEQNGIPTGTLINYTTESGLSGDRITDMAEDAHGRLWISTWGHGITRFDPGPSNGQGDRFVHFGTAEGVDDKQLSLLAGRDHVLWTGMNGGGLSQIVLSGLTSLSTPQSPIGEQWITAIAEDSAGHIWMAPSYGGLIRFDGETFQLIGPDNGIPNGWIKSIDVDKEGNIWMAMRDNGCVKFDGKQFFRYDVAQGLDRRALHGVFIDRDGIAWMSGYRFVPYPDGVVYRFDPSTSELSHYSVVQDNARINGADIYQDRDGMIWIGGLNCVATYNAELDQMEVFAIFDNIQSHQRMPYFVEDEHGNLWVARTPPGLTIEADRFVQLKADGKLLEGDFPVMDKGVHWPDVFINRLTLDADGHVWFSSTSGVFGCDCDLRAMASGEANWVNLTRGDGLKGDKVGGLFADAQNRLWIDHLVMGMTVLHLEEFEFPDQAPPGIGLIDIEIGGKHMDFQFISEDSLARIEHPLAQAYDSLAPFSSLPVDPHLPYDHNHLTFHFSAPDWSAPHTIEYSYMLEGLEDSWSVPSAESKADYRQIPHGTYTFKVRAKGAGNVWSTPSEYTFRILPPWWLTPWAYALYALVIVGSIGGYIMRLQRRIRKKQEQLEREQYLNRELRELNIATTRFVPKDFISILDKKSLKELHLGDQTDTTMTVLFADIRGYTLLSESMTPEENFRFINAYVGRMGPIIKEHGGFICQYYGDGIMALFKEDHHKAIQAAVQMQKTLDQYNAERLIADRKPVNIGIGLNTGHLMLGVIGDQTRYDTSVISDAVNTASRLEGLTKIFGAQIIVSEKTLREIQELDNVEDEAEYLSSFRFLGKVRVKGKDRVLKIYEVFDGESVVIQEHKRKTKTAFEEAIRHYFDRDFGKAANILKDIVEQSPDDVAAQYYMDRSVQFIVDGVEESWSGVEEIVSK
ncbi:MAG: two-component regulator propeller domain-containing protein [Saprospiraceae bacterium]|nr:two-component regulator propeller domain-containing protein [Saprospiraceae bacterium]